MNCNKNNFVEKYLPPEFDEYLETANEKADEFVNEYKDEISTASDIGKFVKEFPFFKPATKSVDILNKLRKSFEGAHSDDFWLFAKFEAKAKSFRNRLICAFDGCVHFVAHTPCVESV